MFPQSNYNITSNDFYVVSILHIYPGFQAHSQGEVEQSGQRGLQAHTQGGS